LTKYKQQLGARIFGAESTNNLLRFSPLIVKPQKAAYGTEELQQDTGEKLSL
jgi:hypothetical protein